MHTGCVCLWSLYFLNLLNHKNSANLRKKKKAGSKITKNTKGMRYFQNIVSRPFWVDNLFVGKQNNLLFLKSHLTFICTSSQAKEN